jgi:hypothetical protein
VTAPLPSQGPDAFQVAMAVARLETKMDTVLIVQASHGTDLEKLKERRIPLQVVTVFLSALGCAGGVSAFLHR